MDTSNNQSADFKPKNNLLFIHLVVCGLGIIFFIAVGSQLGKISATPRNNSVLGVNSSNTLANRLAYLFNANLERPSYDTNTFQLIPTSTTTPTPTPETTEEDEEEELMWGGSSRNPKPTATPSPNNVITVPEEEEDNDASDSGVEEPTPTPKYKAVWNRNHTPTPTISNRKIDSAERLRPEESIMSGFTSPNINTIPSKIQNLLDVPGLAVNNLEIIRSEKNEGIKVTGMIRERFFGLLPVSYPVTISVDENKEEIEAVLLPWWRTLFGNPFVGNISKIRCGDGICSSTESITTCKIDCDKVCGNGICEFGEGQDTCPVDCDLFPSVTPSMDQ